MNRIREWLNRKQRETLQTEKTVRKMERDVQDIRTTVRRQRVHELRIAEVSRVNPVYDRIKGRP